MKKDFFKNFALNITKRKNRKQKNTKIAKKIKKKINSEKC